jgi:hypothetical protein
MDAIYKGDIVMLVKKALLQRQHVLLRAPLQFITAKNSTGTSSSTYSSISTTSRVIITDEERLRECKQVLKSVFMACVAFSLDPLPPAISERTTIETEVTRLKVTTPCQVVHTHDTSREQALLDGKALSELVELEMLISPKPY